MEIKRNGSEIIISGNIKNTTDYEKVGVINTRGR